MSLARLRRPHFWVLVIGAALVILFVRRWIHHAQLESMPVLVPSQVPAAAIMRPPPVAILRRMLLDVHDFLSPPRRPRLATLTFDDGPFPLTTPLLLAQLRALHVPAVFFMIGRDVREQPAITVRIKQAGMELGNHTDTHPEMVGLSASAQMAEIAAAAEAVRDVSGDRPLYFRPPHGNYDATTIEAARGQGELMVLWDVDPGDWRSLTPDAVAANVIAYARSPAVILLHNGRLSTIEALPRIVRAYRAAGFEFVSLAELRRRLPLESINDPVRVPL